MFSPPLSEPSQSSWCPWISAIATCTHDNISAISKTTTAKMSLMTNLGTACGLHRVTTTSMKCPKHRH
uniref:Uncharacterized protein n=1 Tax=Rhizophora mucronata TaxID=61149 RepID=A0A2P2MAV6_RHIMU